MKTGSLRPSEENFGNPIGPPTSVTQFLIIDVIVALGIIVDEAKNIVKHDYQH